MRHSYTGFFLNNALQEHGNVMVKKEYILLNIMLLTVLLVIPFLCSSCSMIITPTLTTIKTPEASTNNSLEYKMYEIKTNYYSLTWCNHPLFSFEYPSAFNYVDLALSDVQIFNSSSVEFSCNQVEVPYKTLTISIMKPIPGSYNNATDIVNKLVTDSSLSGDNISIKKVSVSGITADYLESYQKPIEKYTRQDIYREVFFDYVGLIWSIVMTTYSTYPESQGVQESFNHILKTFEILDKNCNNLRAGNELNITVNYDSQKDTFILTNNESTTLCEVNLFLNYIDEDLYTGYKYYQYYGIASHQTLEIERKLFKKSNSGEYGFISGTKPNELLVQVEFPGCKKVFSYIKTWE